MLDLKYNPAIHKGNLGLLRRCSTLFGLREKWKVHKKKTAAAVYEYQADCDGEWGEIQFNFENGAVGIIRLTEWDTMVSKVFAEQVMKYIRASDTCDLPKKSLLAF